MQTTRGVRSTYRNQHSLIALAVPAFSVAIGLPASIASADFGSVSVERHATVTVGSSSYDVFRLYANFTNAGDRLVMVFGSPTLGSLTFESRNAGDSGAGGAFFNASGAGGNFAPTALQIAGDASREWDTFATIGVSIADQSPFGNMMLTTPNLPTIAGSVFTLSNDSWLVAPTFDHDSNPGTPQIAPPQTVAGWTGDGDNPLRVLMAQLTVPTGDNVRGVVNLGWYHSIEQGGPGQLQINESFQSFNSFTVPSPGALAMLGVAAGFGGRRRRRP